MAYKCPGCSGEISNKQGFLFHLEINDSCAEETRSLSVKKLGIDLATLERIYPGVAQPGRKSGWSPRVSRFLFRSKRTITRRWRVPRRQTS